MAFSEKYIENLHYIIECFEKERHEIINELTTLHGYTYDAEVRIERIRRCITNFCARPLRDMYDEFRTGSKHLDYLLKAKSIKFSKRKITFDADVDGFAPENDLYVVLAMIDELIDICIEDLADVDIDPKMLALDVFAVDNDRILQLSHNGSDGVKEDSIERIKTIVNEKIAVQPTFIIQREYVNIEIKSY